MTKIKYNPLAEGRAALLAGLPSSANPYDNPIFRRYADEEWDEGYSKAAFDEGARAFKTGLKVSDCPFKDDLAKSEGKMGFEETEEDS